MDGDGAVGGAERLTALLPRHALDIADHSLGFLVVPVREEPAWALRNIATQQQDPQTENGADAEAETPTDVGRKTLRIEKHKRCGRAECGTDPKAAVHDEIDPTAQPRGG